LWAQRTRAALEGRFDDARALIDEADAIDTQRFGDQQADDRTAIRYQQRWTIDLLQGRFDATGALPRPAEDDGHPYGRLLAAITAVQRGDTDHALRYHAEVAAHFSEVTATGAYPFRWVAPLWLRFEAEVAAASRDRVLCDGIRAKLAPLTGQWAVLFGDTPLGPYAHWLALVDAAQGRFDQAVDGFTAARDAADRLGARPASIGARAELAAALCGRGAPGDAQAAAGLLDAVEPEALELGMLQVLQRARQTRAELAGTDGGTPSIAGRFAAVSGGRAGQAGTGNVFRFDGQVWTLGFAGRTVHMPDAKGLRDLHVLLGRPGVDVRATDLLDPQGGEEVRAAGRMGGDAVLDDTAKAAYRRRLAELDERIDHALDGHDDRRAAELDQERQALIDELRRATGLGGRSRRLGDRAERARKAVLERIRDTLRRLDRAHPELAEHLRASVSTGASCRYQPPTSTAWVL
jgi:hypothetical protein